MAIEIDFKEKQFCGYCGNSFLFKDQSTFLNHLNYCEKSAVDENGAKLKEPKPVDASP